MIVKKYASDAISHVHLNYDTVNNNFGWLCTEKDLVEEKIKVMFSTISSKSIKTNKISVEKNVAAVAADGKNKTVILPTCINESDAADSLRRSSRKRTVLWSQYS